jgi:glycosyltransferase involved in cell wall biosynthesis
MSDPASGIALVHDYLTQRGGAERVVTMLHRAFPEAPIHTSLYDPAGTYPDFETMDIRTGPLDRLAFLRDNHRLALPFLAPAFSRTVVEADVAVCSSSGWAHGARVTGRKIVYCHNPARWLYQRDEYLGDREPLAGRAVLNLFGPTLRRWDMRAAATADAYLVNSSVVRERVRRAYGIDSEIVHPPYAVDVDAPRTPPLPEPEPGFLLCVSRLLPYKNVDLVVEAATRAGEQLVIVGTGPDRERLGAAAGDNVRIVGSVTDAELRWLYANCSALVAASYEDFGLTPVEAAAFGKPAICLRAGGYLDSVRDQVSGLLVDDLDRDAFAAAFAKLRAHPWDDDAIRAHAETFSPARFITRIREVVDSYR